MEASSSDRDPAWLTGRGRGPKCFWEAELPGALRLLSYARESGDLFATDDQGHLARIDAGGKVRAMVQLPEAAAGLSWSDDGSCGAVIVGENAVWRLSRDLEVLQKLAQTDVCLSVAVSPYGHHLAVGTAEGQTLIYNERKRRMSQFETQRPLPFLRFCTAEAILFGAAEHGLLCCHNLAGALIWQQPNWSNVGDLCVTGEGDLIYLAGFGHGVQAIDGDGANVGSYVLEGTINRIDCSYEPQRLVAASMERSLFWLQASGELIWQTEVDDDISAVICDPLGAWAVCGLAGGKIYRLNWA